MAEMLFGIIRITGIVVINGRFTLSTSTNWMLPSFDPTDLRLPPVPGVNMVRLAYDNTEVGESGLLDSFARDSGTFISVWGSSVSETILMVAVAAVSVEMDITGGDLGGDAGPEREEGTPEEKAERVREAEGRVWGKDGEVGHADDQARKGGVCPRGGEVSRL